MMKKKKIIFFILVLVIIFGVVIYFSMKKNHKEEEKCETCTKDYLSENHPFGFAGPTEPPDDFDKIKELGVNYIRTAIAWDKIETSDNNFDFKNGGNYEKLTQKYNLEPIFRLKTGHGWGTYCDTTNIECPPGYPECPRKSADCPPKDLGRWSDHGYSPLLYDFISKTLEYAFSNNKPIKYILVGNEVNTRTFWHGTGEDFLKTRATVFKAVKDFNSKNSKDVKVIDNGFAGSGPVYIREQYCPGNTEYALDFAIRNYRRRFTLDQIKNAAPKINCDNPERDYTIIKKLFEVDDNLGGPSFDYMAYHFYAPWDTQEEIINWIKQEMQKNGYQKPIMMTEGGYSDYLRNYDDSPGLENEVAADVIKLHTIAFANDIKAWLWLPFTERYEAEFYGPQWKGLVLPNQTKLPAFTSYKIMVEKIDGFTKIEKIEIKDLYIYKFTVKNKSVYVLWSEEPQAIDLSSEISGSVKVTGIDGSTETKQSTNLEITENPVIIEQP